MFTLMVIVLIGLLINVLFLLTAVSEGNRKIKEQKSAEIENTLEYLKLRTAQKEAFKTSSQRQKK